MGNHPETLVYCDHPSVLEQTARGVRNPKPGSIIVLKAQSMRNRQIKVLHIQNGEKIQDFPLTHLRYLVYKLNEGVIRFCFSDNPNLSGNEANLSTATFSIDKIQSAYYSSTTGQIRPLHFLSDVH